MNNPLYLPANLLGPLPSLRTKLPRTLPGQISASSFVIRVFLVSGILCVPSFGQTTRNWNEAAGGSWTDGSHWTPTGAPVSGDTVRFSLPAIYSVDPLAGEVANLTVDAGNVTLAGGISDQGFGDLAVTSALTVSNAVLGVQSIQFGNGATMNLAGGTINVTEGLGATVLTGFGTINTNNFYAETLTVSGAILNVATAPTFEAGIGTLALGSNTLALSSTGGNISNVSISGGMIANNGLVFIGSLNGFGTVDAQGLASNVTATGNLSLGRATADGGYSVVDLA
jgi:hypothetical protein